MSKKNKGLTLGALIAAGVGYLAGLLTAPKSGKETRKDIAKNASKAKTEGEKQLKKLYSELDVMVKKGDKQLKSAKSKANNELSKRMAAAKTTQKKVKLLLTALHDGDAEDPDLKAMIGEAKKAKSDLGKFIKK